MKQALALFSFIFALPAIANDSAIELLDEVRKDLHSFSADFNQYELFSNGEAGERSAGQMWLQAPKQFRWNYTQPVPQLIVANGSKVWIYDEDLEQVTIRSQDSETNPLYVLLDKRLTEQNYNLKLQADKAPGNVISLTPKTESEEIKEVWISIEKDIITQIRIENSMENTVVFEFENIRKNPQLESEFFEFEAPEGTDVIEDSVMDISSSEFQP